MKKIILIPLVLFLFVAAMQIAHILSRSGGGTGPWNSADAGKFLESNGTSVPSWGTPSGGSSADTTLVISATSGAIPYPISRVNVWLESATDGNSYTLAKPDSINNNNWELIIHGKFPVSDTVTCTDGFLGGSSGHTKLIFSSGYYNSAEFVFHDGHIYPRNSNYQIP